MDGEAHASYRQYLHWAPPKPRGPWGIDRAWHEYPLPKPRGPWGIPQDRTHTKEPDQDIETLLGFRRND